MDKILKAFTASVSIGDGDERTVTAKISTAAVDRDGEVLIPQGCNSKDYEKNPVVMLGHDYYKLPIGKCLAIRRKDDSIEAKIQFAKRPEDHPAEKEWEPDTIFSLFKDGVMNAFSVGFVPIEQRPANTKDKGMFGDACQRVYSKWSLLEVSAVPIPANQEAVAMAVSKGLNRDTATQLFGAFDIGTGEVEAEPTLARQIVSTVDLALEQRPQKRVVTHTVDWPEAKAAKVKTLVIQTLDKARGRIYSNP